MTTTGRQAALGFMVCVDNSGYPASLELGKTYKVLPDESAEPDEIRVIDESGEDYLYPAAYFSADLSRAEAKLQGGGLSVPDSDIAREARGFIAENEALLTEGSGTVLGRVFVQGANIFTAISEELVEAANRNVSAKNALAEAIRNPATPARRLQELETQEAHASAVYEARLAASEELNEFLERVNALLPKQSEDVDEEE
jgi:hypothetical protein